MTRSVTHDDSKARPGVPEGMREDAGETWPSPELVRSFFGNDLDFELRLGEHTRIPDNPEAAAQARRFRDVLGLFCSGVTVVTSISDGAPVGMACQSVSAGITVGQSPRLPRIGSCLAVASRITGGLGCACSSPRGGPSFQRSRRAGPWMRATSSPTKRNATR